MKRVSQLWILLFFVGIAFVQGCAKKQEVFEPFGIQASNQLSLRVGVSPDYPPLVFYQDGELAGLEIDMAKLLAYDFNRKIIFVPLSWDELIPALTDGRVDILMSGMSITPERERRVQFAQPYLEVGQMALVRKSRLGEFPNRKAELDFTGRIGYLPDTTGGRFVSEHFRGATRIPFENVELAVRALRRDQIDLFIHDAPTIWRIAGNRTEMELTGLFWPLTDEFLAWAVRPDEEALLMNLNRALTVMKKNGKLRALINHWLPVRVDIVD